MDRPPGITGQPAAFERFLNALTGVDASKLTVFDPRPPPMAQTVIYRTDRLDSSA
jgi:hypothetical protein